MAKITASWLVDKEDIEKLYSWLETCPIEQLQRKRYEGNCLKGKRCVFTKEGGSRSVTCLRCKRNQ